MSGPEARLLDTLPVNPPYVGLVADAYDLWIPPDASFPDDGAMTEVVRRAEPPSLELGSGTGRLLLRLLAGGLDIEGVDDSADMLAICRAHAAERALDPVLHLGSIAPLALDGEYGAIVCPLGTFMLVDDAETARGALASYRDHLHPGGRLTVSLSIPVEDFGARLEWRARRSATRPADGATVMVHEAVACDQAAQVQTALNRIEVYDAAGRLTDTLLRRHRLRWWERSQIEGVLADLGFAEVASAGSDTAWVTTARRP